MNLKNKKTIYLIFAILLGILTAVGISYALWIITRSQTGHNIVGTACLEIELTNESADITLANQYPVTDETGMQSIPYTFTVTNNCNTSIDYRLALESLGDESTSLEATSIKIGLNDNIFLLSSKSSTTTTINNAYNSRILETGTLEAKGSEGSSKTYNLRIWIDQDAPNSEQNKTFDSKMTVTVGQFNNLDNKNNLAADILSKYGGTSGITEIDMTDYADRVTINSSLWVGSSARYYGTDYTLDKETGLYSLSGNKVYAKLSECLDGTKTCGNYTLNSTSSTYSSSTLYEITEFSGNYSVNANYRQYTNEFGVSTTDGEYGLYKIKDDLGDSYYFRGAPENNYVEFGTYAEGSAIYSIDGTRFSSLEECEEERKQYLEAGYDGTCEFVAGGESGYKMLWRIVRINGDGTIRLIYDGAKDENDVIYNTMIAYSKYNISDADPKYFGYTYDDENGNQVDSTIKGVLDNWYKNNLEKNYGSYIADSIFCNDREISYVGTYYTYYSSYTRLYEDIKLSPTLICTNRNDKYTVNDTTNGNGLLTYPIGLITADEVLMAGGKALSSNNNFYLHINGHYWTMTPAMFGGNYYYGSDSAWGWTSDNLSNNVLEIDNITVRPVINLKANVKFTGSGKIDDPYVIVTE